MERERVRWGRRKGVARRAGGVGELEGRSNDEVNRGNDDRW